MTWSRGQGSGPRRCGFTFVEVLAAITLLAIVVPAIVGAMEVAGRAAVFAERDAEALHLAENQLALWQAGAVDPVVASAGEVETPAATYRWTLNRDAWVESSMGQWTLEVAYIARGQTRRVRLATLAPESAP